MEKRKFEEESYGGEAHAQEAESPNPVQAAIHTTTGDKGKRRAIVATQIGSYFKERTTPGSQPTLKSVLASKEIVHKAKLGLAKWIVDAHIPFNAIQSPYFQPALDGVASIGPGFKGPSYDEIRVHLLADLKREFYCPAGISFVKTVDAFDVIKAADALFNLFADVIEWVGHSNIVHVVTDNAANYLLRLVDADEKSSLEIVYEGMQRAKNAIKTMFRNRKAAYTPYTIILKMRWDKHLKCDLHAAAYFLNPGIFYSESFVEKANVLRSLLDLLDVETLCDDSVAAMQEIQLYRYRKESFGRESAKRAASRLEPGEWWRLHGGSAPNLRKMAVRLLHQTSSSSGCERNWSLLNKFIQRGGTDEDDPEFTNRDVEGIESLIYTDNALPSYPNDGGDMEVEVDMPNVLIESSNTSFGGISEDDGFGLPVYVGDIGTLNDDYDF
ncbi:uncharacterized protein [Arachis hypogaea]|uniref:uncharacterized protein n=1 Tax=Arachis hypogaea TaxID=3818 RepID=UPI003B20F7B8